MAETAPSPIPDGMSTLTAYLWFNGNCREATQFYKTAFGAEETGPPIESEDGNIIMHVMLKIGDSNIMMADTFPGSWEQGPRDSATASFWVYVEDCDAYFNRATEAGCDILMPIADAFWGDRFGKVKDPYGHCWAIASYKWVLTPEEMQERQGEWLESLAK
ncbi:MAG: glyoxalase/bleomycin resistance/extradiol dioxygenase family protein [Chloroflexi bacterium]|nr:glyoxalase/bleomycin resistance/extradiol dioxygenase family protein [Chloroflexota bacterium]